MLVPKVVVAAATAPTTAALAFKLVPSASRFAHPPRSFRTSSHNSMNARASPMQSSLPRPFTRCTSSLSSSSEMTENETQMMKDASRMATVAIRAVYPDVAIRDRLRVECDGGRRELVARADRGEGTRKLVYDLSEYDNIRIISFGKASAAMALATVDVLSDPSSRSDIPARRLDGVVIIKDDHATEDEIKKLNENNILVRSASHPVPDARSVAAATEILDLASSSDSRTLIVACISGGGSALFCSPRDTLSLDDLMAVNRRLLESGMPIEHMNVIRKRLENGKGGRLAAAAHPATVLSLVLSDIIGDPLDLIASGPTVPDDGSSWDDAWRLVNLYGLNAGGEHELPTSVLDLILMGKDGKLDDTPKSSHSAFSAMVAPDNEEPKLFSETILVGNNDAAVLAAAEEAAKMGYNPVILGTRVDGEASCVASYYIFMAEMLSRQRSDAHVKYPIASLPVALIAGGETVVTLPPSCKGIGGRNQELALSAAMKMQKIGLRDVVLASVGTDGTDGPTDAAGAIVYGGLVNEDTIIDATEALKNHDAYVFFEGTQSLILTGPTGTNVADICITLVK